jgi:hypothetical protein
MSNPIPPSQTLAERVGPSAVDDVRAIRSELDQQAGHDIHALAENARQAADEFRSRQFKQAKQIP